MLSPVLPLSAAALLLATAPAAQAACEGVTGAGKVRLTVAATTLRNAKGEVAVTVYPDDRKRFLAKGGKLLRARVPANAPVTEACFWLAPGHYAVATYHDENGDRDFNRTLFTIKEGFGFSNDAPTTLGLPSFDKVRFAVGQQGGTVRVRTRYSR
ncbi:Uncharacterized conserved protein, DUF2141 family [Sphingomonas guangdongensis]|uniref:Uncharacterized conserved protein, DUF2141 family n=1 Tax=Sphingomonas guangdongensis TaxID=1141890 RepID=A0A285QYV2_9SPHN|nr:DUF2141 domain-containing protein [Sphingomonas guangdongensis]SOB87021.1 Uncharacterized conserved protein, DUF2141 family [Sphingomonas guangdongensis]